MAEVREKALANRKLARQGEDPLAEKRRTEGIPTFAEAASRVLEQKRAGWRGPRHSQDWISSLRRLAFRRIGKAPVSEVTSADVLEILTPLWHRNVATAKRVRQRLRAVLEWAVAMEYGEVSSPEGTEKLLRPLGFTPQQAEWLTLVCLHSGLFTRDQVEAFFGYSKSSANRFIRALLRTRISHRPIASETITDGRRICRIFGKWRPQYSPEENQPTEAGNAGAPGPGNDRRFSPLGVKAVPSYACATDKGCRSAVKGSYFDCSDGTVQDCLEPLGSKD